LFQLTVLINTGIQPSQKPLKKVKVQALEGTPTCGNMVTLKHAASSFGKGTHRIAKESFIQVKISTSGPSLSENETNV
jgi:hypothetical protein